jgi:hypothetical protein
LTNRNPGSKCHALVTMAVLRVVWALAKVKFL